MTLSAFLLHTEIETLILTISRKKMRVQIEFYWHSLSFLQFSLCGNLSRLMDAVMCRVRELEKLPTYPSPKPMSCPKWEVSVNVGLSFPENTTSG